MSETQLEYASSIAESQRLGMDSRIVRLANQLARIHGKVRITKEASGVHLYMASPICLREYGKAELYKMHLALNADKYLQ